MREIINEEVLEMSAALAAELGYILYRYFQIADTFEYLLSASRYEILLMQYLLSAGR